MKVENATALDTLDYATLVRGMLDPRLAVAALSTVHLDRRDVERISSGLTKTRINILKYDSGRFATGTLGEEFELGLQGITINQKRLLLVTTEFGDLKTEGGKSHLLAYSLAP